MPNEPKKSDVDIDKHNLDVELERQPRLYKKWADRLANAKRELADAKNEQKLYAAELGLAIRRDPAKYKAPAGSRGGLTEGIIDAMILVSKGYRELEDAVSTAQHKVDLMESMVEAMKQKKGVLPDIVKLFLASYFADVRISGDSASKWAEENITSLSRSLRVKPKKEKGVK